MTTLVKVLLMQHPPAWRAGFREGVKMSLNRGTKVPRRCKRNMVAKLSQTIDMDECWHDVVNGEYAILEQEKVGKVLGTDWDQSIPETLQY